MSYPVAFDIEVSESRTGYNKISSRFHLSTRNIHKVLWNNTEQSELSGIAANINEFIMSEDDSRTGNFVGRGKVLRLKAIRFSSAGDKVHHQGDGSAGREEK